MHNNVQKGLIIYESFLWPIISTHAINFLSPIEHKFLCLVVYNLNEL